MSHKIPTQDSIVGDVELALQKSLDQLQKSYKKGINEEPDVAIDRQILAAAQREILAPNKKEILRNSLWRRFSLPLYASATFAFTAFAIHVLLPTPARVPPGTMSGPVPIDIINEESINAQLINKNLHNDKIESKDKLLVPEVESLLLLPKLPSSQIDKLQNNELINDNYFENNQSLEINIQIEGANNGQTDWLHGNLNNDKSGEQNIQYKDLWVRKIINLFKSGDHQSAQAELKRFKKTFPDFPIDEQIDPFRQ